MFLIPFVFIGALALIVWALVEFSGSGTPDSAVAIARRRFASGEISSDEFQQIQLNLGAPPTRPGRAVALAVVPIVGLLLLAAAGSIVGWAGGWGWGSMGGMMGNMGGMMGSGRDSSLDPARQGSADETVVINNFAYSPGNLQVPVGAKVTWTNRDSVPHSATAKDSSWDTGVLRQGQSATVTFDRAGEFSYYCSVHPNMVASVLVRP